MQDTPNQSKRYTIPRLINEGFLLRIPSSESKYKCNKEQILALLESIKKSKEEGNPSFCLGDMIVCREGGRHSIIDGRQRMIVLFLIGVYLASKEVNEGIWHDFVRKEKRYNKKSKKYIRLAIPYERGESWLSELINKTSGRRGLECMRMCIAGYEYFCGLKIIKNWFYQYAKGSLEQGISAYLYHNLYFNFRFISEEVYQPTTKEELKVLCEDESVYLGKIDTSKITDMSGLFADSKRRRFLGIEKWDVSNVEDMSYMFANSSFNHPLILWNVSKVKNMEGMFSFSCFNQCINSWDVSGCENMRYMFHISLFNQPLDRWNVANVKDMSHMFEASSFNYPLNSWNVSNVENLSYMFFVSKYNHLLSSWNVGKVKSMSGMFYESAFNQPLDSWNVANVEDMSHMFSCSSFNQPLDSWDVSGVEHMEGIFADCDYSHSLESWGDKNPFK
ncbi:BspA family leucine-rich repeat surface protein [Helicobacter brantae]|uniref:DUF262 domain-containing protein n=1 Tax=Helicobacter brantae TaxID=375927 RepID=A0A3D8IYE3_9HELI|nr:BspA family leucine-rich repeat surface protein [Helicobacter brantae]RDU70287.1 hypothetical protein CQA58_06070 [Helicobacter brantae]